MVLAERSKIVRSRSLVTIRSKTSRSKTSESKIERSMDVRTVTTDKTTVRGQDKQSIVIISK